MSGIAGMIGNDGSPVDRLLEAIRHRGPGGVWNFEDGAVRLGIRELHAGGEKPPGSHRAMRGRTAVVLDGRVYNKDLRHLSDAEAVLDLYERFGRNFAGHINGDFACAVAHDDTLILARDEAGIKPLYYGHDKAGNLCFASEAKAFAGISVDVREFPPGHVYSREGGFRRFFSKAVDTPECESYDQAKRVVRALLEKAVEKRMSDGAVTGVLLSGGLDSSIIAAIAASIDPRIECYTVSMEGAADLPLARDVTEFLGLKHHVYMFDEQEIAGVLREAIYHQEMFEESCIHGAIANFLAGRFVRGKATCVLSGEGADEYFAGYDGQYRVAENPEERSAIVNSLVNVAHNTALQRLDRLNAANGLESRMPFLDAAVMDFALKIPLEYKIHGADEVGKWILRDAFEDSLPEHLIYQTKRFFSQGSGVSSVMRRMAEQNVSEAELEAFNRRPGNPLLASVEELYYYRIFKETYRHPCFDRLVGRWDPLRPAFFPPWEKPVYE